MINYQSYPAECGIYSITNIINGKRYIGGTSDVRRRAYEHFARLRKGINLAVRLQNEFNIFREDAFIYEIVELCEKEVKKDRENYYILLYKTLQPEFGYNLTLSTSAGYKHTDETRAKIRAKRKLQIMSQDAIRKGALTRTGKRPNFSKEFIAKNTQRLLEYNRTHPRTKKPQEIKIRQPRKTKILRLKTYRPFMCLETKEIYNTCPEAAENLKLSYKVIWKVLNGKTRSYKGLTFAYILGPFLYRYPSNDVSASTPALNYEGGKGMQNPDSLSTVNHTDSNKPS